MKWLLTNDLWWNCAMQTYVAITWSKWWTGRSSIRRCALQIHRAVVSFGSYGHARGQWQNHQQGLSAPCCTQKRHSKRIWIIRKNTYANITTTGKQSSIALISTIRNFPKTKGKKDDTNEIIDRNQPQKQNGGKYTGVPRDTRAEGPWWHLQGAR